MRSPGSRRCLTLLLATAALAFAPTAQAQFPSGDLYVVDRLAYGGFPGGGVMHVDRGTGARSTVSENSAPAGSPTFVGPWDIAVEAGGTILVVDNPGDGVIRVDPLTGARSTVSDNTSAGGPDFDVPIGIAVEPSGDILVLDLGNVSGTLPEVIRVDPTSGARTLVSMNGAPAGGPRFSAPLDIEVESSGEILVAETGSGVPSAPPRVIRVDPSTGARSRVSGNINPPGAPNLAEPLALTLDGNGDVPVIDSNLSGVPDSFLMRVDAGTGVRTLVSDNATPAGAPDFVDPFDLVVDNGGTIAVVDREAFGGSGGVIAVDPASGARTTISENSSPAGAPDFEEPMGIALVRPILVIGIPPGGFRPDRDGPPEDPVPPDGKPGDGPGPTGQGRQGAGPAQRRGTSFSYELSEPARVVFRIDRRLRGRIRGGRCRRPAGRRRGLRCTRYVTIGAFAHDGVRGRNRKPFSGRIGRRTLQPGRYRAVLVGHTTAGHTTVPIGVSFRVLR